MSRSLPRDFYARDTVEVAHDLLGCALVHESPDGDVRGRIVEVEAYQGEDDPACHAAAGRTVRTEPLYGPPGYAYVYLIYGMYHCLNAVTRPPGRPSAVLIRALEPLGGRTLMRRRRMGGRSRRAEDRNRRSGAHGGGAVSDRELANGPGKLCQAFGLTRDHNRIDLTRSPLRIEEGEPPRRIVWTPRVGIQVATERLWRCFDADSPCVSRSALNRLGEPFPRPATNGAGPRR